MATRSFLDCERSSLDKLKNLQLPNNWKKIGLGLFVISFITLFVTVKGSDYRIAAKYGMLIGLLFISISKEQIEDELIVKLRMQSYTFAFVVGVFYALALPFVDFIVDMVLQSDKASLKDMGDFNILWILLSTQVFYFAFIKRFY